MSEALDDVLRRRAVLRARSGIERERLATQAGALMHPVASAGSVGGLIGLIGRLVSRPPWMLVLTGVLLVVRPRRVMAWAGPLLAGWRVWLGVKDVVRDAMRVVAADPGRRPGA